MGRITVFMPVYNAERFLEEAVESILNQTYQEFDFLVIDDGSTDQSYKILEYFKDKDSRISLYKNEVNKGVCYTRNRGLALCNTEYIAFMDADDIAPRKRLEKELDFLDKHLELAGVGGIAQNINEDGEVIPGMFPLYQNPDYIRVNMMFENTLANGSVMLRTNIYKKYGIQYWDKEFAEDYRFFSEYLQYGKIANLNEIMQHYRVVSSGLTQIYKKSKEDTKNLISDEIHKYWYQLYGFDFSEEEEQILLKCFRQDGRTENKEELQCLYRTLKSMCDQAETLGLEDLKLIQVVCRKQFGKQVARAFWLWK
ncbi:MAG: glycosyltransferase [Lachnospiraceae bacterium]|jgi:glycosyltransferase involved in cell wall biosynthesis|nr:glycosyltransferase [Lachnospiraceae bacterium]